MAKRPGVSATSRFIAVKDQHSTLYTRKKNPATLLAKFFSRLFNYIHGNYYFQLRATNWRHLPMSINRFSLNYTVYLNRQLIFQEGSF